MQNWLTMFRKTVDPFWTFLVLYTFENFTLSDQKQYFCTVNEFYDHPESFIVLGQS